LHALQITGKIIYMTNEQAIKILVEVAKLAQKGGLLTLEDANAVLVAIQTVRPKVEEEVKEPKKK
jgi:chemotaxis methyl-accepting protein methylase